MEVSLYKARNEACWWFQDSLGRTTAYAWNKEDLLEILFTIFIENNINQNEYGFYLEQIVSGAFIRSKKSLLISPENMLLLPFEQLVAFVPKKHIGVGSTLLGNKNGGLTYYIYIFSPFFLYDDFFTKKEEGYNLVEKLRGLEMIDDDGYTKLYTLISNIPEAYSNSELIQTLKLN